MTKRNIEIKVRLSRKEAENLNKQVKKCRLSREAYLRHLITGEVPREAPPPEYFRDTLQTMTGKMARTLEQSRTAAQKETGKER